MGRLASMAGEKVHTRTIEMSTFAVDASHILYTGHFRDVRHAPSLGLNGYLFEAGDLHNLEIHVLLKLPELIIEDIEVSINTVPMDDCNALVHSLDAVVGIAIGRGFTGAVKNLAGSKIGCTHLVHLLTTMAPAMLQGYWALLDAESRISGVQRPGRAASGVVFLKDSCHAWREEGAAFQALRESASSFELPG